MVSGHEINRLVDFSNVASLWGGAAGGRLRRPDVEAD
jgi:hypothetical protein